VPEAKLLTSRKKTIYSAQVLGERKLPAAAEAVGLRHAGLAAESSSHNWIEQ
jgi:hypothetical protein